MTTCQLSVSDHTTSAPVAVGLSQPTRRSSVLAHHTGRYQRSSAPEFQTFYWLTMCYLQYMQNLRPSGVLFSKETVWKISDCTWKSGGDCHHHFWKWWWHVTTVTYKVAPMHPLHQQCSCMHGTKWSQPLCAKKAVSVFLVERFEIKSTNLDAN